MRVIFFFLSFYLKKKKHIFFTANNSLYSSYYEVSSFSKPDNPHYQQAFAISVLYSVYLVSPFVYLTSETTVSEFSVKVVSQCRAAVHA